MGEVDSKRPSPWRRLLMYALAAAALLWVFHDVHPRRLWAAMTVAYWSFVALAVAVDILTYVLQGIRWKLLLAPVGRIRPLRATQAIYAGLFTNEVMPLRFGELVRAFLASRWVGSGIAGVVPSMLIERFLDAIWLALGIGLAAILVPLPHNLLQAGDVLGGVVVAATLVFAWIVFRKEKELEHGVEEPRTAGRVSAFVRELARGLREIGLGRRFGLAAVLSAGMIACQALAVWFMMLACGIHLHVGAGAVVFLVVRLGTAIPNAPANVGSFQFFTVLGLGLFGVDKTVAAGFSVVDFVALTAPLWILGLLAVSRTGMTLGEIRTQVNRLARGENAAVRAN